jgi:hypothetical protein
MMGTFQVDRLPALIAAATSLALPFILNTAHAGEALDTVTVEAQRERELHRQISNFVSSFDVTYLNASLERWNSPICPLVAGLPSERGEFILARLSQIARDSHAPLAPEHCRPNLYVVVTGQPDALVEKWTRRDRNMFNSCSGYGYVKEFLHSRQPVRAFYNAELVSSDGAHRDPAALDVAGLRLQFSLNSCVSGGSAGSRLTYGAVRSLQAVVVVVDIARVAQLNMGQLADYVSMVGLAQIRLDADTGTAPTILGLFHETDSPPQGLSLWDRSFLEGLYNTDQSSTLQVNAIKSRMFDKIAGH